MPSSVTLDALERIWRLCRLEENPHLQADCLDILTYFHRLARTHEANPEAERDLAPSTPLREDVPSDTQATAQAILDAVPTRQDREILAPAAIGDTF